jgi:crotonobetainyl-CoA:carnitine CoA-transferase CaiB-like acyl-CoA transferase
VRTQPLAGVRVLCFTQAWSGTWGTEILSLLGADVVQIEGRRRPDVWRGPGSPIGREVLNEAIPQNPLNTNGMFNSVNLNKRAVTLDMTVPEGREIFWRLVPRFDVVCENFSPKVMANWGITLETLRASRPDIIFGSISGYGHTGPTAMYPANGNTTEPMAGLSSINGYVGDAGSNTGGFIPDPVSGYHFAAAVIAALVHRARTGAGQRIDCAMVEAVAVQLGDAVLEYSVNGNITKPAGNRHPRIAPHSMYPAAGDDWVAIAAETEPQWQALATLVGIDATGFGDMAARKSREAELDALIAAWTRDQDATRLEGLLTSHGIVAARVRPFLDIYRQPDPDLLSRGYLQQVTHPETGAHYMPTLPWRLHRTPAPEVRYSPCFGEHSENVFGEELGMTAADYQRLESRGITGKTRL